jgi:hypothetical protein
MREFFGLFRYCGGNLSTMVVDANAEGLDRPFINMLLAVRWAWTSVREGPRRNFAVAGKGDDSAPVRARWHIFIHHFECELGCAAWHLGNEKRW